MSDPALEPGEYIDVESLRVVRRKGDPEMYFLVEGDDGFTLHRNRIKDLAEVAGFDVYDR